MELITDKKLKVAIQGIAGCFHHAAAEKYFQQSIDIAPAHSFEELIKTISDGSCNCGLMAIENSIAGNIISNYHLLEKAELYITGEVSLAIEQHLMALPGTALTDIKQIYSHPVALQQCGDFLKAHPQISLKETPDTALSAKDIADGKLHGVAAIAGIQAAKFYGLDILKKNLESRVDNKTRFLVLSRQPNNESAPLNKASLYFKLSSDQPSLTETVYAISRSGVKLIKIQITNTFTHIDITFDHQDQLDNALKTLSTQTERVKVLGIYKREN